MGLSIELPDDDYEDNGVVNDVLMLQAKSVVHQESREEALASNYQVMNNCVFPVSFVRACRVIDKS